MVKVILTDIEGTTSSITFVKDVLFPYARAKLPEYVAAHGNEPAVRKLLDEASEIAGGGLDDSSIVEQMQRWIDEDRKVTPLKSLQGLIWEAGYLNGDFTGHMYQDATEHLKQWYAEGLKLYVYSSGSVYAQKLLYGYSDHGDLTPLFSGYFDTHVGGKKESASYDKIAKQIGIPTNEILFLSDIAEELDAAKQAGMQTCQLVRDVNVVVSADHPQAKDFSEIKAG